MNILKTLFSSGEIVKTAGKVADGLHYSSEEKGNLIKSMYDQFTPRSISRRLIAVMITSVFLIFCLTGLVFSCLDNRMVVDNIIQIANAFQLGYIQLSIIIFYFGYYGLKLWKK